MIDSFAKATMATRRFSVAKRGCKRARLLGRSIATYSALMASFAGAMTISAPAIAQQASNPIYAKAKAQLSPQYYSLYRVVEKISRANNLSDGSWRVKLTDEYALAGFSEQTNLIRVPRNLLEQLSGDNDAIACMVSREISHHIRKHNTLGPLEKEAQIKRIKEEALAQATANANSKRGWGMGLGILGGLTGVDTSGVQGMVERNTDNATAKMVAEKQAEMERKLREADARIEQEADEDAFVYLTRAGRDPKGCIRYLEVISRDRTAEPDPRNPLIPGRLQSYRDFINRESADKYKREGQANLARNPKPLSYSASDNGASLRVNSSRNDSIDRF
jgi:predicted Zn-dependent protease